MHGSSVATSLSCFVRVAGMKLRAVDMSCSPGILRGSPPALLVAGTVPRGPVLFDDLVTYSQGLLDNG